MNTKYCKQFIAFYQTKSSNVIVRYIWRFLCVEEMWIVLLLIELLKLSFVQRESTAVIGDFSVTLVTGGNFKSLVRLSNS